jgi:hypothetical protein
MKIVIFKSIFLFIISFSSFAFSQEKAIIADHSVVNQYQDIPQKWIDAVKKMYLCYPGESHSAGLVYGFEMLQKIDSRFAINVTWRGEPERKTDSYLRVGKTFRNQQNSRWEMSGGEEDFFTSQEAVNMMLQHLTFCEKSLNNPVSAFGFGWCWDMTGQADVDAKGWAGRLYWPVKRGNHTDHWDTTTTNPCMQDYIDAVVTYNKAHPECVTFFTTGPVDGGGNARARGYQRWLKNEFIRNYVKNSSKVTFLFDYADILCWNNSGQPKVTSWNGMSFPYIHPENIGNYNGGSGKCHISQEGCLRLAKAMWWLLAKIAENKETS